MHYSSLLQKVNLSQVALDFHLASNVGTNLRNAGLWNFKSNCDKILYLPDGRIAAKLPLGRLAAEDEKQRDKKVAGWLMGMGW